MTEKRPRGRPRYGAAPMRAVRVMLSPEDEKLARKIGDGNMSAGIRKALRAHAALDELAAQAQAHEMGY